MAKTSKIVKNDKRKLIVAKHADARRALKKTIANPKTSDDDRVAAYEKLREMPRDASATRIRNRCAMTGRPRAYLKQFGLSRISFRDMALNGLIPGVRKASW
jgi:small subunit ribosomal protein S14